MHQIGRLPNRVKQALLIKGIGKRPPASTKSVFRKGDLLYGKLRPYLDIFWLKDDSLENSENLPPPAELAAEIVESLEAALEEFRAVEDALASKEN